VPNSVCPGAKTRGPSKLQNIFPDGDERFLDRILGFIRVAKNSVRGSQKPRTEITHQFLECFRLTRFQTFYQGSIFAFGH
jgi:hypothetical protein